jgi:hypothetical protein
MQSVVANEGPGIPQADFLENRFNLTPAQARLVIHLTAGKSLRSSAEALGVKYERYAAILSRFSRKLERTGRQS